MPFIAVTKKGVAEIAHQDIIRDGKYPCTSSADENETSTRLPLRARSHSLYLLFKPVV
jgi:hypothetical protein